MTQDDSADGDRTDDRSDLPEPTRRRVLSYGAAVGAVGLGSAAASAQESPAETATGGTETPSGGTPTEETPGEATETTTAQREPTAFRVRIENVSAEGTLAPSDGSQQAVPLSPGVYAVHTTAGPLFTAGAPAPDNGLEALAERGNPSPLTQSLAVLDGVVRSGAFDVPANADSPGPIGPGQAYEFTVRAGPGQRFSFATMFVQSNDLFFAPAGSGVSLFDETNGPIDGSITEQIRLWDAGTEANEEPGVGPNQAPRQSDPDAGPEEDRPVRPIAEVNDGHDYPAVSDVLEVTVTPLATQETPTEGTAETETAGATEAANTETPEAGTPE